jgi:hypothetical protein
MTRVKNFIFDSLCLFHIFLWAFVAFAFLNPVTAKINLYYLIPFIYVVHILPFHILNKSKESLYGSDWEDKANELSNALIIPGQFIELQNKLDSFSFCSPISPQCILIFGAISSAWSIK